MPLPLIFGKPLAEIFLNKYVIGSLAVVLLGTSLFVGGCVHGERVEAKKTARVVAEYKFYVKQTEENEARIKAEARIQLADANITLATANADLQEVKHEVDRLLKENEVLTRTLIPNNIARVFNYSATGGSKQGIKPVAKPERSRGVDEKAGTATAVADQVTLKQLLDVVTANNINHLKCINQVTGWQTFYTGLYSSFEEKYRVSD